MISRRGLLLAAFRELEARSARFDPALADLIEERSETRP
jgi:hypothetical protein